MEKNFHFLPDGFITTAETDRRREKMRDTG
jgi:hypothetical protein